MPNVIISAFLIFTLGSCFGQSKRLDLDSFMVSLQQALSDSSTGWGVQVMHNQNLLMQKTGGFRVSAADSFNGDPIPFNAYQRMHIASISKSITAIATAQMLQQNDITWEDKIGNFLPTNWVLHESLENTTFKDLLEMKSGLKAQNDAISSGYYELKRLVERGVNKEDIGKFNYQNVSYGLLRVLIAKLNGFIASDSILAETTSANAYINYVNQNLLEKCGIKAAYCRETSENPTFMYPFPYRGESGLITGFSGMPNSNGDLTNYAGGLGWYLSVNDVAKIFSTFFFTDSLMDKSMKETLLAKSFPFSAAKSKFGNYISGMGMWIMTKPGQKYNCGINTVYILFPDNLLVVAFVNSTGKGIKNIRQRILSAYEQSIQ
jgi:CubicO group peptidase (beta-lactamase class C family)